jgi:hypothetical protein
VPSVGGVAALAIALKTPTVCRLLVREWPDRDTGPNVAPARAGSKARRLEGQAPQTRSIAAPRPPLLLELAMRTLQEWMGHSNIQTTQRYADYCPNVGEREVVEAAFARTGTDRGKLPV